jgi:essential nuclear protein 1
MAVKKAVSKTAAFFKGFLLPLSEDSTAREAVIIGSILSKVSINTLDSAAVVMKLSSVDYKLGSGVFLKTMLAKKSAMPTVVINQLVNFFCQFSTDSYTNEEG